MQSLLLGDWYVKHVLPYLHDFLLGIRSGDLHNLLVHSPWAAQKSKFLKLVFMIL